MLEVSRNTVRCYLRAQGLPRYRRERRATKLDDHHQYTIERVRTAAPEWIPATVLLGELKALGYRGSLTTLKMFLATLKPAVKVAPVIRLETEPGRQLQADFATIRRGTDRLSVFIATLGWSRATYIEFVTDERLATSPPAPCANSLWNWPASPSSSGARMWYSSDPRGWAKLTSRSRSAISAPSRATRRAS